jgi:cytochrome P450
VQEFLKADPIISLARPELLASPYPAYRWLLENQPVFWYEPFGSWMVTRHADCVRVLRDGDRFAADWTKVGEKRPPGAASIQTLDPPEHTVIRHLMVDALRTRGAAQVERMVAEEADALLTRLEGRTSFDLVRDFAQPLALSTITAFLGSAPLEEEWFIPLAENVAAGMDAGLWPERMEPARRARADLAPLLADWLARPERPGIIRHLAEHMPEDEAERGVITKTLAVVLLAGYSSSSMLLALAIANLLEGPTGLDALPAANPARAVDELIRYVTPVQATARACVADTELGGMAVRAGQAVTLLLGAADHDPARFPEPDVILLDRHPNPHLGFGRGAHACLGAAFAAVQARIVLYLLAARYPGARAVGTPAYRPNLTLRTLEKFEIALR